MNHVPFDASVLFMFFSCIGVQVTLTLFLIKFFAQMVLTGLDDHCCPCSYHPLPSRRLSLHPHEEVWFPRVTLPIVQELTFPRQLNLWVYF